MNKATRRYRALMALANDPGATDAERATARKMAEQYADAAEPEPEAVSEIALAFKTDMEKELAHHVLMFFGVESVWLKKSARSSAWRKKIYADLPTDLHSPVRKVYARHRPKLNSVLKVAASGYLYNAMPVDGPTSTRPLSFEEEAVLIGSQLAGQMNREQPDAPPPRALTNNQRITPNA